MGTRLKRAVAAIWLLALPAALPSDAGATDAPVPRECQNSNLSPQAQARCDFIARTPNLCVRSGLSGRIQQFCDQRRFAGEPHFNLVKLARNGAVRSIHLIRTETGQEVFTGYPYGTAFAASRDTVREVRIKTEDLAAFVQGRPTPAATLGASDRLHRSPSPGAAPSGFASGLPIGWNEFDRRHAGTVFQLHDQHAEQQCRAGELQLKERRQQHRRADQRLGHGERRVRRLHGERYLLLQ